MMGAVFRTSFLLHKLFFFALKYFLVNNFSLLQSKFSHEITPRKKIAPNHLFKAWFNPKNLNYCGLFFSRLYRFDNKKPIINSYITCSRKKKHCCIENEFNIYFCRLPSSAGERRVGFKNNEAAKKLKKVNI